MLLYNTVYNMHCTIHRSPKDSRTKISCFSAVPSSSKCN